MADTGATIVGTGANVDRSGAPDWSNPDRITSDDGSYAGVSLTAPGGSDWLVGTNLGFAIPSGATIDGVEVSVQGRNFTGAHVISRVALWNSGGTIGTIKTPDTALTGSDAVYTYGNSSDTWGATLNDTIINGSGFGAAITATATSSGQPGFDYMSVTVHYTEGVQNAEPTPASVTVTAVNPALAASGSVSMTATPALVNVAAVDAELIDASITWIQTTGSVEAPRPSVTLALFNEARTERLDIDINSRVVSVLVKTAVNRGYDELSIGIAPPREQQIGGVVYGQLPEPLDLREFARAELRIGGHRAFEGRLGPVTVPATQLVIHGHWRALYGDDWYASTDTTLTTGGEVIRGMLAGSVLAIRPADGEGWQDPLSEHAPVEFDGRSVGDALVQITSEGDAVGNSVDWYVWDDRRLHLMSRVAPMEPDYRMPIDPETMTIFEDKSVQVTRLTVEFRASASGTATVTNGNTSVTVTHGLGVTPGVEDVRLTATSDLGAGTSFYVDNLTSTTFRINLVQEEQNSGSSSVPSGSTSVDVTHGMSRTPTREELRILWSNLSTNDHGDWKIDTIGASTFRLSVRNDPGSGGATFDWGARFADTKQASDPGTPGADFAWTVEAGTQRTSEASNPALESEIGRTIRRKYVAGAMTLAAAERIRDRLIVTLSRPRYSARVRVGPGEHLTGPHGEIRSKVAARAGEWGQIANLPMLLAIATQHDVTGDVLDVTFGEPLPTVNEQLKRLARDAERRSRGIDPESGGSVG